MLWGRGQSNSDENLVEVSVVLAPGAGCVLGDEARLYAIGWRPLAPTLESGFCKRIERLAASGYRPQPAVTQFEVVSLFPIPDVRKLLASIYTAGARRASSELIKATADTVFHLASLKKFSQIDELLAMAKLDRMAPELLVALLRFTVQFAPMLSAWHPFRRAVADQLTARGFKPDKILVGLMDEGAESQPAR